MAAINFPMKTHKISIDVPELYWLLHHEVLLEMTSEPIENRLNYIKKVKPKHERATRLRNLKKVANPSGLPSPVYNSYRNYIEARAMRTAMINVACFVSTRSIEFLDQKRAWDKRINEAYRDFHKAVRENQRGIRKLHRKECPKHNFDYRHSTLRFPKK